MKRRHRRVFGVILIAVAVLIWVEQQPQVTQTTTTTATPPASTTTSAAPSGSTTDTASSAAEKTLATAVLATLDVKGRAPKPAMPARNLAMAGHLSGTAICAISSSTATS